MEGRIKSTKKKMDILSKDVGRKNKDKQNKNESKKQNKMKIIIKKQTNKQR